MTVSSAAPRLPSSLPGIPARHSASAVIYHPPLDSVKIFFCSRNSPILPNPSPIRVAINWPMGEVGRRSTRMDADERGFPWTFSKPRARRAGRSPSLHGVSWTWRDALPRVLEFFNKHDLLRNPQLRPPARRLARLEVIHLHGQVVFAGGKLVNVQLQTDVLRP